MKVTGERLTINAGMYLQLETEHLHRYKAVSRLVTGKNVLDAACGTGYGTEILADYADKVVGIDIDPSAISFARENNNKSNVEFLTMSVTDIKFKQKFDTVVSFETIEHLNAEQQIDFLTNIKRVLKDDGILFVSTPDRKVCTEMIANGVENPYHQKEFYHDEYVVLLKKYFKHVKLYYQNMVEASIISDENSFSQNNSIFSDNQGKIGKYLIAVCSNQEIEFESLKGILIPDLKEYYIDKYRGDMSSLYVDCGCGFSEEDKIVKRIIFDEKGNFQATFNLDEYYNISSLRFDPCEHACRLEITGVRSNIGGLSLTPQNAMYIENGADVFMNNNPFYIIKSPKISSIEFLEISGNLIKIKDDEVNNYIFNKIDKMEKDKKILENQIEELESKNENLKLKLKKSEEENIKLEDTIEENNAVNHAEVNRLNNVIIEYQKHTSNLERLVNEQHEQINYKDRIILEYKNSFSWKITIPIRVAGTIIRRMLSKHFWLNTIRKIYRSLPIKQSIKNKLKDVLFIIFKPLIKDTNTYKIWYNFKHPLLEKVPDISSNLIVESSGNYIEQIMSIPFEGTNGIDYVEKRGHAVNLSADDVKYIVFYLPQFHPIPENDEWWGKGFTEWTNVTKAVPQFTGHYQPRLAGELGYYDLRRKEIIQVQMELARFYGVYGFCIYYYWFDGKTLLETPLKLIIDNPQLNLPFCLCWANENWSKRWDGKDKDVLIAQSYDEDFPLKFIKDISKYMMDNRYIKIDGKPLIVLYNANDIPKLKETLKIWRDYCRNVGLGEIHILAVDFALNSASKAAGFDGFVEFPPHSIYNYSMPIINDKVEIIDKNFKGIIYDYGQIVREKKYLNNENIKIYKGIFLGWDNTARKKNNPTIFHNFSIPFFREWLYDITKFTKENYEKNNQIVFINAWNEWAEGTYLEPDRHYGYAALDSVREVILNLRNEKRKRIFYVSHDACFNGAQMLSLNIIKQLTETFHYDVYVIIKNGGELEADFRKISKELVCLATDFSDSNEFVKWIKDRKIKKAMCNTVVTGDVLKILSNCDVECISMIHEMEKVIKQYSCESNLESIIKYAHKIVFASDYVRKSVSNILSIPEDKTVIHPQGMYLVNTYLDQRKDIKSEIRIKYNLDENCRIVLGVGYGYFRKGTDLFIKTALDVCEKDSNVAFIWVGDLDNDMNLTAKKLLSNSKVKDRIIFAGNQKDLMKYYVASDLFLLTSREDPFPSVVMEAMYASLPVIAFEDGGGYVEIVNDKTGKLVPMENFSLMADVVEEFLANNQLLNEKGENAHKYVSQNCNFIGYVYKLLSLLGEDYPKVSVIIPNYNYERYLEDRIESVLRQTYPIYEIIILDDNSTDNSIKILKKYSEKYPIKIRLIINKENSGNVFKQWEKGLKNATGEYIWIAEADDLSEETFLESIMEKMLIDKNIVMGYTQSLMIDEKGNKIGDNYLDYTSDVDDKIWRKDYLINAEDEIIEHLSIKNTIPNVSAVVFKNRDFSEMLDKAKNYSVAGDWMFYVSLLRHGGQVLFIAESLNKHRRHTNSVTSGLKAQKHFQEICDMQHYVADSFFNGDICSKAYNYRNKVKKDLGLE